MMAFVSERLFGSRIVLGGGNCGIRGIFGSCQDRAKQNAATIIQLFVFPESLAQDAFNLEKHVNDKLFLVAAELAALKSVQGMMLELQIRNWNIFKEVFENFIFQEIVTNCCSRDKGSFFSFLAVTFANSESYRGVFYIVNTNMVNSTQPLLKTYLLLSLVPVQLLPAMFEDVTMEQWHHTNRLSLDIPIDEIIA